MTTKEIQDFLKRERGRVAAPIEEVAAIAPTAPPIAPEVQRGPPIPEVAERPAWKPREVKPTPAGAGMGGMRKTVAVKPGDLTSEDLKELITEKIERKAEAPSRLRGIAEAGMYPARFVGAAAPEVARGAVPGLVQLGKRYLGAAKGGRVLSTLLPPSGPLAPFRMAAEATGLLGEKAPEAYAGRGIEWLESKFPVPPPSPQLREGMITAVKKDPKKLLDPNFMGEWAGRVMAEQTSIMGSSMAAAAINPLLGLANAGLIEAGSYYEQAKREGATDEQAASGAALVGVINGLLEFGPIGYLTNRLPAFSPLKQGIKNRITQRISNLPARKVAELIAGAGTQAGMEAITEYAQESVSEAARRVYDEEQSIWDAFKANPRNLEGAAGGLLMGFGAGAGGATIEQTLDDIRGRIEETTPTPKPPKALKAAKVPLKLPKPAPKAPKALVRPKPKVKAPVVTPRHRYIPKQGMLLRQDATGDEWKITNIEKEGWGLTWGYQVENQRSGEVEVVPGIDLRKGFAPVAAKVAPKKVPTKPAPKPIPKVKPIKNIRQWVARHGGVDFKHPANIKDFPDFRKELGDEARAISRTAAKGGRSLDKLSEAAQEEGLIPRDVLAPDDVLRRMIVRNTTLEGGYEALAREEVAEEGVRVAEEAEAAKVMGASIQAAELKPGDTIQRKGTEYELTETDGQAVLRNVFDKEDQIRFDLFDPVRYDEGSLRRTGGLPELRPLATPEEEASFRRVAERAGVRYEGMQERVGKPPRVSFTEPETKSTLTLEKEEFNLASVQARVTEARAKAAPPTKPTEPIAPPYELIRKKSLTSAEQRQLKKDIADLEASRQRWQGVLEKHPTGVEPRRAIEKLTEQIETYQKALEPSPKPEVAEEPLESVAGELSGKFGAEEFPANTNILYNHPDYPDVIDKMVDAGLLERTQKEKPWLYRVTRYRVAEPTKVLPTKVSAALTEREKERVRRTMRAAKEGIVERPEAVAPFPFAERPEPREAPPTKPEAAPVRRSQIVRQLGESLGVPIRVGRFRKRALGIFKQKPKVIRTKLASDVEVTAHEAGHAIQQLVGSGDWKAGGTLLNLDAFGKELHPLTPEVKPAKQSTEGFAEFVRLYVTDEQQARTKAPTFYAQFERVMGEHPDALEALHQARTGFTRWVEQPGTAKVLSHISTEPDKPQLPSLGSLYSMTVDQMHPIKRVVEEAVGKNKLNPEDDPYLLARVFAGWPGKAEHFLKHGTLNTDLETTGDPLEKILRPIEGRNQMPEFTAYMVARRAKELHGRGVETGMTSGEVEEALKENDSPHFRKAFEALQTYNDALLGYLRDSGVMSEEGYKQVRELNQNYVPFYRIMEEQGKGRRAGTGMTFADIFSPMKRIKGSGRDIVNPMESILRNTYTFINLADRNVVAQKIAALADTPGAGKWIEEIPTPVLPTTFNIADIQRELKKANVEVDNEALQNVLTVFRPEFFRPRDNIITVLQDGKRKYYQVDPDLYRAVKGLDREQADILVRILRVPARMLRAGATALNPEFALARNPLRDQFTAGIFSKYDYRPFMDFFIGLNHLVHQDDMMWTWKSAGGAYSMLVSMDRNYLQKDVKKVMAQRGAKLKNVVRHPVDYLRVMLELSEAATRIGEFGRAIKKEGMTKRGKLLGAFAAREVGLDFSRRGSKTGPINQVRAFWNAQLQGWDKLGRAFREDPKRTSWKVMAMITVPSIALMLQNRRDPRWKELPDWQKDFFWIIFSDKHIFRIPKPFELGLLFGSFPERVVEHILDHSPTKKTAKRMLEALNRSGNPGIVPTGAVPLMEWWANKSIFRDRPLVPYGRERLRPELQYGPYTSETMKLIGKVAKVSPAKLDNTIYGLTGGLGRQALRASDWMLRNLGVVTTQKPAREWADIPMLRAIMVRHPSWSAQPIADFYELYELSNRANLSIKALEKEGKKEEATALRRDAQDLLAVLPALGKTKKQIGKHRAKIDAINKSNLSPEQKRKQIEERLSMIMQIAGRAVKRIEARGIIK